MEENRFVKVPIDKYDLLIRNSEKINILIRSIDEYGRIWSNDEIVKFLEL